MDRQYWMERFRSRYKAHYCDKVGYDFMGLEDDILDWLTEAEFYGRRSAIEEVQASITNISLKDPNEELVKFLNYKEGIE